MKHFITTTLAVVALIFFGGCSENSTKRQAPPAPVLVAVAVVTNVPVQINPAPIGHVLPYSTVSIRAQVGGVLQEAHFSEGAEVKKGDLLFSIDPRPSQAALARDKAQLENAQIQFDREQKLFEQKLVSQDEFDTARAARDTLAATVQADELNLSYCEIRAPFDGIAGAALIKPGNVVKSPDDILLTINKIHPIYVTFSVAEKFLPEIRKEMAQHSLKVSATFENMTGAAPEGELDFVDNSVDTMTGMIQLRATFPNEENMLWPGQFVNVELTLSELANAIVVPSQALQVGQNGQFVYVISADQTAEMRPVKAGIERNGVTVIESGLKAGETVVIDGQLRLAPKMKVTIKNSDSGMDAKTP